MPHQSINNQKFYSIDVEQYLFWLEDNVEKEKHPEKLKDFFLKTNDSYSQCIGLEYLLMHGYDQELLVLIDKNEKSKHQENREWAYLYQLIIAKQKRLIKHDCILEKAEKLKSNDCNFQSIQLFLIVSVYIDLFENEILANRLDELQEKVNQVNHRIFSPLVNHRLRLILFNHYWKKNEIILARKYGFEALPNTINSYHLANLHINLSLSYIFDDFESTKYHLNEAYKIAKAQKFSRLINMIEHRNKPFIYAHFNKPNNITTPIKSEQAHLSIARGNLLEAQQILSEVTENTPFTKYYLGRAHQDHKLLLQSYNEFLEYRSDYFFARLPLTALKKL